MDYITIKRALNTSILFSQLLFPVSSHAGLLSSSLKYTKGITNSQLQEKLPKLASALEEEKVFYRWGGPHEADRIGRTPAFDVKTVNRLSEAELKKTKGITGTTKAGLGLYVAENPFASAEYGDYLGKDAHLIAVTIPKGSKFLDLTDPKTLKMLAKENITPDIIYRMRPPPQIHVKYDSSNNWWVLKTAEGIKVEDYGTTLSRHTSEELAKMSHMQKKLKHRYPHAAGLLEKHHSDALRQTYFRRGSSAGIDSATGSCTTSCASSMDSKTIESLNELSDELSKSFKIKAGGQPDEYLWSIDGTCGSYRIHNNTPQLIQMGVEPSLCRSHYPTTYQLISDLTPWKKSCYEVVKEMPTILIKEADDKLCQKSQ
jgi:hypothetical protein